MPWGMRFDIDMLSEQFGEGCTAQFWKHCKVVADEFVA